jgi:V8-like Glu-specific endopeptidase
MIQSVSGTGTALSGTFAPEQDSGVSTSVYPYNTVVLLETTYPGTSQFFDGTGVIIGPHTILTASHMLWNSTTSKEADHVYIYPGYNSSGVPNPAGTGALSTSATWHNFQVGNLDGTIGSSDSQFDYAVIDVSFTFSSWMGIKTGIGSGSAHLTGYPVTTNGLQDDQFGTYSLDPSFSLYDYGSIFSNHGNSGGPLWIDADPSSAVLPYVIGIASSTTSATEITAAKFDQINAWVAQDGYSLSASTGLVSINDVSVTEGNSGSNVVTFTVTRTGGTAAFSVNYSTSNGSATVADNDYVAKSGTLNFGANVNTQTITITINGDTKFESNETFFVNLSGATNGVTFSDSQGLGTIVNDDLVGPVQQTISKVERFFDSATGDHFYSLSTAEAAQIRANLPSYHDEGAPWSVPSTGSGTQNVYRFFDVVTHAHFFTDSAAERAYINNTPLLAAEYHDEGVAFQDYTAAGPGTLTLERFFNTISHMHTYGASAAENASIRSGGAGPGWVDEGPSFIVHT